jgi:hypothetical protein
VGELEELGGELDVDQAAVGELEVPVGLRRAFSGVLFIDQARAATPLAA